jgi:hypothetical protein
MIDMGLKLALLTYLAQIALFAALMPTFPECKKNRRRSVDRAGQAGFNGTSKVACRANGGMLARSMYAVLVLAIKVGSRTSFR